MRFGIFSQIWIPYTAITAILFVTLLLYYPNQQKKLIETYKSHELRHIAQAVTVGIEISLEQENYSGLERTMNFVRSEQHADFVAVILADSLSSDPTILFSPDTVDINKLLLDTANFIQAQSEFRSDIAKGSVIIGYNKKQIQQELRNINNPILISLLLLGLVALVAVYFIANQITQPILKLTELSERLSGGEYNNELEEFNSSGYELTRLKESLYQLATNLSIQKKSNVDLTQNLEIKIHEQTERLQALLNDLNAAQDIAQFANFKFDLHTNRIEGSKNLFKLLGIQNEENFGRKKILRRIQKSQRGPLIKGILNSIEYGNSFKTEIEWSRPDNAITIVLELIIDATDYSHTMKISGVLKDISDRKRKEEELYILSNVAKRTSNLVIITDTRKRITWVNESVEVVTGYSRSELLGLTPRIFQGPKSDPQTITYINENLREEKPVWAELINHAKNGDPYWISVNIVPMRDELGKLTGFMAVETEITERKTLELQQMETIAKLEDTRNQITQINLSLEKTIEEKTKSIKNLALIPQHNPNPVMELNLDTKEISYHNYAAGHYLKNLLYLPFDEVLQYLKINAEGQLIQSGERETFIGDKAFEITTFKLSGDSLCRVYLHDITLRKQNEIQLSELIEQLKMTESALVQKTQQLEASLSELEKAQSDILNKERLSTLGVLIAGIAHEINSPLGAIKASGENLNRLFDDCFNDIIPFLPPEDLSLSIQLFKKRKLLNLSTKEERERNRQIDAFLKADIPDDIDRHIVTRILVQMGYTTVDDETSRIIKHVNATNILRLALNFVLMQKSIVTTTISSDQSSKVVRALNTFAHGNINEETSTFSLKDNIETVITIFWNKIKQGANVRNNVPDDIRITGMADEITQVWTNLINNALYASNNKCNITIDYHTDDIFHVVTVSNDGPQIPENVITRIFEPFFTTKSRGEGTGLGLNIVQRVMEKHKGKISCISNAQNTSFIVSIPKNDHLG